MILDVNIVLNLKIAKKGVTVLVLGEIDIYKNVAGELCKKILKI